MPHVLFSDWRLAGGIPRCCQFREYELDSGLGLYATGSASSNGHAEVNADKMVTCLPISCATNNQYGENVPLNIAIVSGAKPTSGGGYDYERGLKRLLARATWQSDVTLRWFHFNPASGFAEGEGPDGLDLVEASELSRLNRRPGFFERRLFRKKPRHLIEEYLLDACIDLVYFTSPNPLAMQVTQIPIISTVWDVGHRDYPEMPEFRGSTWSSRERLYSSTLPRSFHVFTDSLATGASISRYYGVLSNRWTALGITFDEGGKSTLNPVPPPEIPDRYFIYPARRWAHKNHAVLLRAMKVLLSDFPDVKLVLTGGPEGGSQPIIEDSIRNLGLGDNVIDLGHVTEEKLVGLIAGAVSLVMPTYLGPTNIPPLQALGLGTPAIVSDSHVFDPVIQDHLTVVPASDIGQWVVAMKAALATPLKREPLTHSDNQTKILAEVLERFEQRMVNWKG